MRYFGTLEFIHTSRKPTEIMDQLTYVESHRLWRANPKLAFEDMKKTHRDCSLINQDVLNESNLFDKLVTEALKNQTHLSPLRAVVEKELLHHDILRVMRDYNFFTDLTFIGGTCLRFCYDGIRLSEDLNFTGGANFSRKQLSEMGKVITKNLQNKYGLHVVVNEPVKDKQNVDAWKIKIETRSEAKDLPNQRINIDICTLPSYERQPMILLNPYGVDMGTSGLIIQAQSREEI